MSPSLSALPSEIAFVFDNVGDWSSLTQQLPAGVHVVVLDSRYDGMTQMAQYLAQQPLGSVDAVHIFSHGSQGQLHFGSSTLNNGNLDAYADALGRIGAALSPHADLLLYGCNVAAGLSGITFVNRLSQLAGADVAASDDRTGAARLGGDWVLEAITGTVDASYVAVENYEATLAVVSFTGDAGNSNAPNATFASGAPKTSLAITNTATSDT